MRFLAHESCDFSAVRALHAAGHDVLAVSEFQQRSIDQELMETAHRERRILLTEDKDFGWLTFVARVKSTGVVLIRFPAGARQTLGASITRLVSDFGDKLSGAFVVLSPGSIRISRSVTGGRSGV